jgi:hypothetical protein
MKLPRFTTGGWMTIVATAALLARVLREIGQSPLVP